MWLNARTHSYLTWNVLACWKWQMKLYYYTSQMEWSFGYNYGLMEVNILQLDSTCFHVWCAFLCSRNCSLLDTDIESQFIAKYSRHGLVWCLWENTEDNTVFSFLLDFSGCVVGIRFMPSVHVDTILLTTEATLPKIRKD